jgi:hypothetical protein
MQSIISLEVRPRGARDVNNYTGTIMSKELQTFLQNPPGSTTTHNLPIIFCTVVFLCVLYSNINFILQKNFRRLSLKIGSCKESSHRAEGGGHTKGTINTL